MKRIVNIFLSMLVFILLIGTITYADAGSFDVDDFIQYGKKKNTEIENNWKDYVTIEGFESIWDDRNVITEDDLSKAEVYNYFSDDPTYFRKHYLIRLNIDRIHAEYEISSVDALWYKITIEKYDYEYRYPKLLEEVCDSDAEYQLIFNIPLSYKDSKDLKIAKIKDGEVTYLEDEDSNEDTFTITTSGAASYAFSGDKNIDLSVLFYSGDINKGDINASNSVDANDALLALKFAAKLVENTQGELIVGDMNANGAFDSEDALYILQIAARLEPEWEIALNKEDIKTYLAKEGDLEKDLSEMIEISSFEELEAFILDECEKFEDPSALENAVNDFDDTFFQTKNLIVFNYRIAVDEDCYIKNIIFNTKPGWVKDLWIPNYYRINMTAVVPFMSTSSQDYLYFFIPVEKTVFVHNNINLGIYARNKEIATQENAQTVRYSPENYDYYEYVDPIINVITNDQEYEQFFETEVREIEDEYFVEYPEDFFDTHNLIILQLHDYNYDNPHVYKGIEKESSKYVITVQRLFSYIQLPAEANYLMLITVDKDVTKDSNIEIKFDDISITIPEDWE